MKKELLIEELKRIESVNGLLTPTAVVIEAYDEKSPLHNCFEWQDDKAANKYRLWQARQLISTCRVTIEGRQKDVFYNVIVNMEGENKQGYVSLEKMITQDYLKEQVLANALAEIKHWQQKYKEVKELSGIVDETKINQLEKVRS